MKMQPVTSSNIAAVGHEGSTLRVQFNKGPTYEYANVTPEIYKSIVEAESVGATFNILVKSKPAEFPFKKIS